MNTLASRPAPDRADFIDRLRVTLTALVITHHAAITYGASGGWFYREVADDGSPSSLLLTLLTAVNQSFFMGMFFLLAGYFTPGSWRRKGGTRFLGDRLVRLGVPLLAFGFVLGPMSLALTGLPAGKPVFEPWLAMMAEGAFVIGPLWFALALLIFAAGWSVWATLHRPEAPTGEAPAEELPHWPAWLFAALAVGAAALLLRQVVPVGESVFGLQLGYFASYVFLFALGCHAARSRWLERVNVKQAAGWGAVSLLTVPWLFVSASLAGAFEGQSVDFNGGLGGPAVVYAFWEPLVAWGIIAGLLFGFRTRFNKASERWRRWNAHAYGAFIVHAPVLVALSVLAAPWKAPSLVKFGVIAVAAVLASFQVAALLHKIPGAKRII